MEMIESWKRIYKPCGYYIEHNHPDRILPLQGQLSQNGGQDLTHGVGVIVYSYQEGRGIGLENKIKAIGKSSPQVGQISPSRFSLLVVLTQ